MGRIAASQPVATQASLPFQPVTNFKMINMEELKEFKDRSGNNGAGIKRRRAESTGKTASRDSVASKKGGASQSHHHANGYHGNHHSDPKVEEFERENKRMKKEIMELKEQNATLMSNQISRETEIREEVSQEMAQRSASLLNQIQDLHEELSKYQNSGSYDITKSAKKIRKKQLKSIEEETQRALEEAEEELERVKVEYEEQIIDLKEQILNLENELRFYKNKDRLTENLKSHKINFAQDNLENIPVSQSNKSNKKSPNRSPLSPVSPNNVDNSPNRPFVSKMGLKSKPSTSPQRIRGKNENDSSAKAIDAGSPRYIGGKQYFTRLRSQFKI